MPFISYSWLMLAGIIGLWFGFPNTFYHIPILVLLYPLSLFTIGNNAKSYGEALRKGWLVGLLGASAALYWLSIPIHNVGNLPWPLAIPCALFIGAYVGFYGGLFSLASFSSKKFLSPMAQCVALACLWYGLENFRGFALSGFPWLQLGSAFVPWPMMIQAASIVGAYALSSIYVCAALFIYYIIFEPKLRIKCGMASIALMLIPTVFGFYTLQQNPIVTKKNEHDPTFILVEGNIDQNVKWEPALQAASLKLYQDLSLEAVQKLRNNNQKLHNAIIIWPETAMPFFLERHPTLTPNLTNFISELQIPLIVGAPGAIVYSREKREIFNRAYLINTQGNIANYYDKIHLVPFGEYVPSWLKLNFLEPLLQGIGNFTPGNQGKPLLHSELALGMLICYESVFPDIARQRVHDGANILVNISNDGWFGDSSAPEQHLQLGILRAVEQGRFLVRSTNTGISAIVDNFGRFILKGEQFKAQSLTGFAKPLRENTIFFNIGPFISYAILSIFLLTFVMGRRRT